MRSEIRGSDVFSQTFHLVGKMLERLIFLHGGSNTEVHVSLRAPETAAAFSPVHDGVVTEETYVEYNNITAAERTVIEQHWTRLVTCILLFCTSGEEKLVRLVVWSAPRFA
jgi:hypothetical protein